MDQTYKPMFLVIVATADYLISTGYMFGVLFIAHLAVGV